MKILVDTNLIMDVLTKREPFYLDSAKVWTLIDQEILAGYISAISINNLYYIINKLNGRTQAEQFIEKALTDFEIISLTKDILRQAHSQPNQDFEDLIQYFSALHEGCEALITRNKKDFPSIGLDILTPKELLRQMSL